MKIRDIIRVISRSTIPACFVGRNIYVDICICPSPESSPYLDQHSKAAYCRYNSRVCSKLQMSYDGSILCKSSSPSYIEERNG